MTKINFLRKTVFGFLIASLLVLLVIGCDIVDPHRQVYNTNHSAVESFSFEVNARNKSELQVESINGPIEIVGVSGATTVSIWGERKVESESETDAHAHLRELEIQITESGNTIHIETVQPKETYGRNYTVYYQIRIPNNWSTSVDLVNGEVGVDSLNNDVIVALVNGNIILREITGNVFANTVNGQVDGNLTLPRQGVFDIKTVNGVVLLTIPKTTSAELSATVTNGSVNISELPVQNMSSSNKKVQGRLGSGEGRITLKTTNGNINVAGY